MPKDPVYMQPVSELTPQQDVESGREASQTSMRQRDQLGERRSRRLPLRRWVPLGALGVIVTALVFAMVISHSRQNARVAQLAQEATQRQEVAQWRKERDREARYERTVKAFRTLYESPEVGRLKRSRPAGAPFETIALMVHQAQEHYENGELGQACAKYEAVTGWLQSGIEADRRRTGD